MQIDLLRTFSDKYKNIDTRTIGLELEFPLTNTSGDVPSLPSRNALFSKLKSQFANSNVLVTEEIGLNVLELGVGPCGDIATLNKQAKDAIRKAVEIAKSEGIVLLAYGLSPFVNAGREQLSENERYHHYEKFSQCSFVPRDQGVDIHLFTVSASCQVHVDVAKDEAVRVLNVLNKVAGAQIALTANSAIFNGAETPGCKALREKFYDISYAHENNLYKDSFGVAPHFESMADYLDYLTSQKLALVSRAGKTFSIPYENTVTKKQFFHNGGVFACESDGQETWVSASPSDVLDFASDLEFCARLAPKYGTLESRVSCQQPEGEISAVPAFVLGCAENTAKLESFLDEQSICWKQLRLDAIRHGLKDKNIRTITQSILDIAKQGLVNRRKNEEIFLAPLYSRLENHMSPADTANMTYQSCDSQQEFISSIGYTCK